MIRTQHVCAVQSGTLNVMPDTTPRAWLCKHCGERVDPTMDLCWQCGYDRKGNANPSIFVEPIAIDLTRCGACRYSLKGNSEATHCPECGEPVPWVDCPECGVRGSRLSFEGGCPACRAVDTDVGFEPEVEVVGVHDREGRCRGCGYDMRGRLDAEACPECGFKPAGEMYDTRVVEKPDAEKGEREAESKGVKFWFVVWLWLFPAGLVALVFWKLLSEMGYAFASLVILAVWVVSLGLCTIQLLVDLVHKRY